MQERNILHRFKQLIGEYCAINQYIELSLRCFADSYAYTFENPQELEHLAYSKSLSLSHYNATEMLHCISRTYIVNINLCFETFLREVYELLKKYGLNEIKSKNQNDSWLDCILNNVSIPETQSSKNAIIDLCNYYRLVRNSAVHDKFELDRHKVEYSMLKKYTYNTEAKFSKLNAPNNYDYIQFDDFVMFSRACQELAAYIYSSLEFNYVKIAKDIPDELIVKWLGFNNRQRLENAVRLYINSKFKIDVSFEKQLPAIIDYFNSSFDQR